MRREPLYLISACASDSELHYRVSGSTGNVYEVTIDQTLRCSCPDASAGARRHEVLCKHGCFVVRRVLGEPLATVIFCSKRRNRIADQQFEEWRHVTHTLPQFVLSESPSASVPYLPQFVQSQSPAPLVPYGSTHVFPDELPGAAAVAARRGSAPRGGGAAGGATAVMVSSDHWSDDVVWREAAGIVLVADYDASADGAETHCTVCFDALVAPTHTQLVRCGTCSKCLHRTCADQWIRTGDHDYCVYCRSDLAYAAVVVELDQQRASQKRRRVRR